MIVEQVREIVEGPLDHPWFERSLLIRPTVPTPRANRFPSQAVVVTSAARRLIALAKEGEKLRSIVVEAGEKDPTLHPEFREISENLRELRGKWFPKAQLCLLSDQPSLESAEVRRALSCYDRPVLRLEAGFQKTFCALTGEKPEAFRTMVENMGRLEVERLIVRACFVRGAVDNSKENEVRAWIRHLDEIRPARVQISTPARPQGKSLRPVPKAQMSRIAELVTEKTGIPVEVCAAH
ncbi:MAG: hypothetical protein AB1726_13145 [Planctomycetota bacterium]